MEGILQIFALRGASWKLVLLLVLIGGGAFSVRTGRALLTPPEPAGFAANVRRPVPQPVLASFAGLDNPARPTERLAGPARRSAGRTAGRFTEQRGGGPVGEASSRSAAPLGGLSAPVQYRPEAAAPVLATLGSLPAFAPLGDALPAGGGRTVVFPAAVATPQPAVVPEPGSIPLAVFGMSIMIVAGGWRLLRRRAVPTIH